MQIIDIALKDLNILLKDKRAMSLIILMPIVLILILGFSLNSLFEDDKANIQKSNIVLVDYDNSEQSKKIKNFLESDSVSEYIALENMDENAAKEKLKKGEITALIVIDHDYNKAFTDKGEVGEILLYKDKGSEVESSIVESIIEKYSEINSSILLAADAAETEFQQFNLNSKMIIQGITEAIDLDKEVVKDGGIDSEGKGLSAMQYYSAAMVSMYILFVGMVGSSSIIEEREENTLARLLTTTANKITIISGKFLGIFLLGILDVSILILFTKFVYGVSWGESVLGIIALSLAMTFAASGLSILIATIFKSSKTIDMVNPVIILVISFIGGNMIPLYEMSDMLSNISLFLLNNWSLRGYINLMINNIESIITPCLVLIAMGTVFLSIGINRLKLR